MLPRHIGNKVFVFIKINIRHKKALHSVIVPDFAVVHGEFTHFKFFGSGSVGDHCRIDIFTIGNKFDFSFMVSFFAAAAVKSYGENSGFLPRRIIALAVDGNSFIGKGYTRYRQIFDFHRAGQIHFFRSFYRKIGFIGANELDKFFGSRLGHPESDHTFFAGDNIFGHGNSGSIFESIAHLEIFQPPRGRPGAGYVAIVFALGKVVITAGPQMGSAFKLQNLQSNMSCHLLTGCNLFGGLDFQHLQLIFGCRWEYGKCQEHCRNK